MLKIWIVVILVIFNTQDASPNGEYLELKVYWVKAGTQPAVVCSWWGAYTSQGELASLVSSWKASRWPGGLWQFHYFFNCQIKKIFLNISIRISNIEMLKEHFTPPDIHVSKQPILWCVSKTTFSNVRDGVLCDNEAAVFLSTLLELFSCSHFLVCHVVTWNSFKCWVNSFILLCFLIAFYQLIFLLASEHNKKD